MAGDVEACEESLKQERPDRRVNTRTRIRHANLRCLLGIAPRLDLDLPAVRCELDGIQEKVIDTIANFAGISLNRAESQGKVELQSLTPLFDKWLNVLDRLAHERAQVDRPAFERPVESARG